MKDKTEFKPFKSRLDDAEERWQARLRMWDIEDQGGYVAAVERELDGPPERHLVYQT